MTSVVDRNMSKYIYDKILGMLDSLSKEHKDQLYQKLSPSTMKLEEMRTYPTKFAGYLQPSGAGGPGVLVQVMGRYETSDFKVPGAREAILRQMTTKLMLEMLENTQDIPFRFVIQDHYDTMMTSVKIEHRYIPFT